MSGYWAIGRVKIDTAPAITMKMEMTDANIGLSIKNRLNISGPSYFLVRSVVEELLGVSTENWPSIGVTG